MKSNTSFVCGTSDQPLIYQTIGEALDQVIEQWGDKEAVVVRHQGIRWSYREFGERIDAFAAGLLALDLQPGDRVGIWSPNNIEWLITQFATSRAGLILVNINPAYRQAELTYTLNKVGCKALILASEFKSSNYVGTLRNIAPAIDTSQAGQLQLPELPDLRSLVVISEQPVAGMFRFADIEAMAPADAGEQLAQRAGKSQPDDPINIQFTSGTTGLPKGATLTHFNVLNNGYFTGEAMKLTAQDRLCIPVPLYHCFGMVLGVLNCVTHGAAMIFPSEAFEARAVLEAVSEERCTALHGVPTMFIAELEEPDFGRFDLSHLRTGIMAGAPCPIEVMRKVISEMNMTEVTIAYGMTETSPVSFQSSTDDPLEKRVATVGRIHPHVQVKIIDEHGAVVPRGTSGELCTRGYSVMLGYWGEDERTKEDIDAAGWMHTGDLAVIDDEGYCDIVGRVKDMIIRGGENIYPREIEEYLFQHPKVQEAAVFGVPDERFGEAVAAWIKLHDGQAADADEIRQYCKEQIAYYKVPKYIVIVDEFPMTVTGKIQKFKMREKTIETL
ncbi:MAG: AMP-binding protein [Xanthomonadales bacterium]|nr:AMP-binding protein [Gammaproteobacteria bacterium]NNK03933.1 AMP-binding protein [Xanthomonadales bacterium]